MRIISTGNSITIHIMVILLSVSACMGCNSPHSDKVNRPLKTIPDTILKGNFNAASGLVFDSVAIDTFLKARPDFVQFTNDFKQLYRLQKFNYVWYDKKGITEATSNLINHVQTQESDGILKALPYKTEFIGLANQLRNGEFQKPSLKFELMLTAQYFNYAKNKWGGAVVGKATDMGWYLPKKKLTYAGLLQRGLTSSEDSVEQTAVIPQYLALKKALNTYQELEKHGPDILVPYSNNLRALKPGDTSKVLPALRARLTQLGDLKQTSASAVYDDELQQAVKSFKERHGISPDAKLSADFFNQINTPLHQRIQQMIVNLERLRWIPVDDHGGEFILVNIPEFKLHYYVDNKPIWDSKVVVGKVMTKTVIFSGHLKYVVFSPYWYIPPSIIAKEIKPGMARNSNYLASHNMEWNGGNVRQKPGIKNSLGLVKFIFPNSNNIYLHDTPAKPLFNEDDRAFSHGCIRVAQPRELAIRILKQMPQWTPEKIEAAMHAGAERTVVLKKDIPVYIGYFTAFVNSKGVLNFREDVYQRDQRLLAFLMK